MLDIKFIRENIELMKEVVRNKRIDLDIDEILDLDKKRRAELTALEGFSAQKNRASKDIVSAKSEEEKQRIISKMREIDKLSDKTRRKFKEIDKKYKELMLLVPNVYSNDTPIGSDDGDNKEIYRWGNIPQFDFPVKNHIQLGKDLDLIDVEKGARTSGFRGYYLKNEAALMQIALMEYAFDKLRKKGFTLMIPPILLRSFALVGSGHFPEGKDEIFQVANPGKLADGSKIAEPLYLGGTSEPSLLAYYADTVLDEKDLPIKLAGFSSCYRSEVGSYGKDTLGLYRLHEFMKIEQVIICSADLEISHQLFEELGRNSQEILEELGLPYRVVQVCTGDMGTGKYEMRDIETWMPSRQSYSETHSNSALTDWQARRLNIKYRTKNGNRLFAYTLNDTMVASPRILIPILENYQQKDGTVKVPKILQKYIGKEVIEKKTKSK